MRMTGSLKKLGYPLIGMLLLERWLAFAQGALMLAASGIGLNAEAARVPALSENMGWIDLRTEPFLNYRHR